MMSLVVIMPLMGCDGCGEEPPVTPEPTGQFVLNDCGESYTIFWYYAEPQVMVNNSWHNLTTDVYLPAYHNDLPVTIIGHDFRLWSTRSQGATIGPGGQVVPIYDVAVRSVVVPYTVEVIDNRAFRATQNNARIIRLEFEENSRLLHIGDMVFADNSLRYFSLPDGLLTVGCHSFSGFYHTSLGVVLNLVLPESLERIGSMSFAHMIFRTVYINRNLQYVGEGTFTTNAYDWLWQMDLHDENEHFFMYGTSLLRKNDMTLIVGAPRGGVSIPHGTLRIGRWAFRGRNTHVHNASLTIPPSVQSIGDEAFPSGWHGFRIFCDSLKDMLIYRRFDMIGQDWWGALRRHSDEPVVVVSMLELRFGEYTSFSVYSHPVAIPVIFSFTAEIDIVEIQMQLFSGLGNTPLDPNTFLSVRMFNLGWDELFPTFGIFDTMPNEQYFLEILAVTSIGGTRGTAIINLL